MIAHIVEQGWLDGRFKKAPKEAPDKSKIKRDRIDASIARWEAKARRAETALRKLRRQKAYYDRKAI